MTRGVLYLLRFEPRNAMRANPLSPLALGLIAWAVMRAEPIRRKRPASATGPVPAAPG